VGQGGSHTACALATAASAPAAALPIHRSCPHAPARQALSHSAVSLTLRRAPRCLDGNHSDKDKGGSEVGSVTVGGSTRAMMSE
jgi:hypothetical protein